MFDGLKKKWKVGSLQFLLIIITFTVGGLCTGWAGKKIMNFLDIQQDWLWATVYILLMTIIWPAMVLLISFPFGQLRFFLNYTRRLGEKIGLLKKKSS